MTFLLSVAFDVAGFEAPGIETQTDVISSSLATLTHRFLHHAKEPLLHLGALENATRLCRGLCGPSVWSGKTREEITWHTVTSPI